MAVAGGGEMCCGGCVCFVMCCRGGMCFVVYCGGPVRLPCVFEGM